MDGSNPKDKAAEKLAAKRQAGIDQVLGDIAQMPDADRVLAQAVHDIAMSTAPTLVPRLWYGMPAYTIDGDVVVFFQSAAKFKTRYATLGFQHDARLDEGDMWPVAFALTGLGPDEHDRISSLIARAVNG